MKISSDNDKSNECRMFLLRYIDKELKSKENANSFFVQRTINNYISNFKFVKRKRKGAVKKPRF